MRLTVTVIYSAAELVFKFHVMPHFENCIESKNVTEHFTTEQAREQPKKPKNL